MFYFAVFVLTVALTLGLIKLAPRLGLIDIPSGRKAHEKITPVVGGLAMFLAFGLSIPFLDIQLQPYWVMFVGILLLVVTGILDDVYKLSPRVRFVVQIVVALLTVLGAGIEWGQLGNIFGLGNVTLNIWTVPFTVFAVVGVINAFNMIDGVDGLAGGVSLAALLPLGLVAWFSNLLLHASILFLMASIVLAFLCFNLRNPWRKRASVFMGDAGSMMLGFILIWFVIDLSSQPTQALSPISALWFLAIPVIDTLSTIFRRLLKKQSPFMADREHMHHIFLRAGYSATETVVLIIISSMLFSLVGLLGWYYQVVDYILCYLFLALMFVHFMLMHHAWRFMRVLKKINRRRHLFKVLIRSKRV